MYFKLEEGQRNRIDGAIASLKFVRSLTIAALNTSDCDIKPLHLLAFLDQVITPLDEVIGEVETALVREPASTTNEQVSRSEAETVPDTGFSCGFDFSSTMWLLRALRDGPAVLNEAEMVAAIDVGMRQAKDKCKEGAVMHGFWRATVDAYAAAKSTAKAKSKSKSKPAKLRRVA